MHFLPFLPYFQCLIYFLVVASVISSNTSFVPSISSMFLYFLSDLLFSLIALNLCFFPYFHELIDATIAIFWTSLPPYHPPLHNSNNPELVKVDSFVLSLTITLLSCHFFIYFSLSFLNLRPTSYSLFVLFDFILLLFSYCHILNINFLFTILLYHC